MAIFAVVLMLIFQRSIQPGMVLFANDAPLGLLFSQSKTVWSNFLGYWIDAGWIGQNQPSGNLSLSPVAYAAFGPLIYAKYSAPLSLLFLAVSACFFCRRVGINRWAGALAGLAAGLNTNPLSYACWGLPPKALALGCTLAALGLLQGGFQTGWRGWLRVLLAGLCVGLNVVEGADVGAILSLYVAAFAVWQMFAEPGAKVANALRGAGRLALVAVCAGWIAAHALASLVGTQIQGVSGMQQNQESREQRWEFATAWSFPKTETLRIVVPGLFGYRMDTPGGGAYWGAVGPSGTPQGRFSGDGQYAGVLVVLVAAFAVGNSLRKDKSPFTPTERKYVWFWAGVAVVSLLLSYGKFAPFYQFVFALPYFSTIRIPMKFLHGMHLALWILFAYGLEALARSFLASTSLRRAGLGEQLKVWRKSAPVFERRWVNGSFILLGIASLAALIYSSRMPQLARYLSDSAIFSWGESEPATAAFSIREAWLAVLFLAASVTVLALTVVGWFNGARARWAWIALGTILVVDLVRANTPWVKHYDYQMRYQTDAVLDVLRQQPNEHRVTAHLSPRRSGPLVPSNEFVYLQKEWLENQFQYYNIQSLDIDQMPRTPELDAAFLGTFDFASFNPPVFEKLAVAVTYGPMLAQLPPQMAKQVAEALPTAQAAGPTLGRLWQLTNTRYVIASRKNVDALNDYLDPVLKRFRVALPFTLALKPGAAQPTEKAAIADLVQLLKATPNEQGPFALIEFGGALPRAKLYTRWETVTNDPAALARLRSPEFDPERSVVLAAEPVGIKPSPETTSGDVAFASYAPKHIVLKTKSTANGVLLLNDRWHADWQVSVDGQPAPLLRANFIMRGVAVPAGDHTVEFRFDPPHGTLWVSLSAIVVGLLCLGVLAFGPKEKTGVA